MAGAGKVPPKVWVEHVATYLEARDLPALALACRLGRAVASDEALWKYWTLRRWGPGIINEYVGCSWRATYARLARRDAGRSSGGASSSPPAGTPAAEALLEPPPPAATPYLHPDPWFFNRWVRNTADVSGFEPGLAAILACAAARAAGSGMAARPGGGFPLQSVVLDVEAHLDATRRPSAGQRAVPFYPSPRPPYCDVIPRVPLHTYPAFFTPARFRRDFEQASCPALFPGAAAVWPAHKDWATMDSFAALTGEARFNLANRVGGIFNLDEPLRLSTPLAQYLAYIRGAASDGGPPLPPADELPLYIFDAGFAEKAPALLGGYSIPALRVFEEDLFGPLGRARRPDFRWIVVGPARSGTPWHIDPNSTSAWNALLAGRKRWALYPPSVIPPGVVVKRDGGGRVLEFNCPYTAVQWYAEVFPSLQPRERPLEVLQGTGDVIFIPSGWWHMVLNLDETVSVTQNYVGLANLPSVIADVALEEWDVSGGRGKVADGGNTMSGGGDAAPAKGEEGSATAGVDAHGVSDAPVLPPHMLRGYTGLEAWRACLVAAAEAAAAAASGAPRLSPALLHRAFELSCSYMHAYRHFVLRSSAALAQAHRAARVAARAAAASSPSQAAFAAGPHGLPRLLPLTEDLGLKARFDAQLPEISGQHSFASFEHLGYVAADPLLFFAPLQQALAAAQAVHPRVPSVEVRLAFPGGVPYVTAKALTSRANPTFGIPGGGEGGGGEDNDAVVVKFFSPCLVAGDALLFDPARAFAAWQAETAVLRALSAGPSTLPVATPKLLASGYLLPVQPGTENGWVPPSPPPLADDPQWQDVGVFGGGAPLAADGSGWVWPYIVMSAVPGKALGATLGPWGEEEEEAAEEARQATAAAGGDEEQEDEDEESDNGEAEAAASAAMIAPLASLAARLHTNAVLADALSTPPPSSPLDVWRPYLAHLITLRRTVTNRLAKCRFLPPHLLAAVEHFLPPAHAMYSLLPPPVATAFAAEAAAAAGASGSETPAPLVPAEPLPAPAVLHCDFTLDNILALPSPPSSPASSPWPYALSGLIDFADARLGDPLYDCIPLHGAVFRFQAQRLDAFLQAYAAARAELHGSKGSVTTLPASLDAATRYRAMCLTLLFPVDAFRLLVPAETLQEMESGSGSSSSASSGGGEEDEETEEGWEEELSPTAAVQRAFQACPDLHAAAELLFGGGLPSSTA